MNVGAAVVVDSVVWAGWGTAVGWAVGRMAGAQLPSTPTWAGERRLYERLGVRRWKHRLPEAGAAFGGRSKRRLPSLDATGAATYAVEARRAELVHLVVPAAVVVFPLWNPRWLTAVMVVYAVAANVPCLVAIRYNRVRLAKLLPC